MKRNLTNDVAVDVPIGCGCLGEMFGRSYVITPCETHASLSLAHANRAAHAPAPLSIAPAPAPTKPKRKRKPRRTVGAAVIPTPLRSGGRRSAP